MPGIVLKNAILADIDPIHVEPGELRIEANRIAARGAHVEAQPGDEVIDCGGGVVLPGLVNGHTHLYSALAVGMPTPTQTPRKFLEILQLVWWRLDRALDDESNETSATIGALDALRCGTTTLIDHHASPSAIPGSLDAIERGIDSAGLRGVLCYEVTDRNGAAGCEAGLEENRRYIVKTQREKNGRFAALSGAHASFTLRDASLVGVHQWADEFSTGVHIHVAEDACDERISKKRYGKDLLHRLAHAGLVEPSSIFAHCIHLNDEDIAFLNDVGLTVAHNPRSNMNNAVGYAPIAKLKCPIMLGTDGIGADLFTEAKVAWFKSRDGGAGISPAQVIGMLASSARRASTLLHVSLGKLEVGAAADVVVTDYVPFSPITSENFPGHFIFAMGSNNVRHVIADGRLALRDRVVICCDEPSIRRRAVEVSRGLWDRMSRIP